MVSATEALGLVMAVLDGHNDASDPTDPVGSALGTMVRALPGTVAAQAETVRQTTARPLEGTREQPSRPSQRVGTVHGGPDPVPARWAGNPTRRYR